MEQANVDSPPSIDVILANIDEQPQNDKKIKIVERPQIDIQLNEQLDDTMCGKYSSPLDHMQCDDDVNESRFLLNISFQQNKSQKPFNSNKISQRYGSRFNNLSI